jgi:hypothetical protein
MQTSNLLAVRDCFKRYHRPSGAVELSIPSSGRVSRFVDRCLFHAGVTLERDGWIPPLGARGLEEEHRFLSSSLLRSRVFFVEGEERSQRNKHV